jgi:peptide/nickel transport system permease protein
MSGGGPALLEALVDVGVAAAVVGAFVVTHLRPPFSRSMPSSLSVWRRLLGRVLSVLLTVATAVVGVGAAAAIVPGDPIARALGEDAPESARAQMAETLGLHHQDALQGPLMVLRPLAAAGRVSRGLVTGAISPSRFVSHRGERVWGLIGPRLLSSASLGLVAIVVGLVLGVFCGLFAAPAPRGASPIRTMFAVVTEAIVVVVAAIPRVVLGPALVFILAVQLRKVPAGGDETLRAWLIPVLTLSLPFAATVARHVRAAAVVASAEPFARTALARGLAPSLLALRHVLPHALVPVVQLTGLQAGAVLSGALIVERVCSWPGLATLLLERLQRGDTPVVVAIVAVSVVIVVVANAAADVVTVVVDPRGGRP